MLGFVFEPILVSIDALGYVERVSRYFQVLVSGGFMQEIISVIIAQPGRVVLYLFLLIFVLLAIRDATQKTSSIKRNFPLLGVARYAISAIGPELRQYLFANDREERPVPRYIRNWIEESSTGGNSTVPFGTQLDISNPGTVLMRHSAFPVPTPHGKFEVVIGPDCPNPYKASVFNVSAMSYGSLGARAVAALSYGAKRGGFFLNTGEGGVSPYHLEGGGDLVWQLGTAKFGCRASDGSFDQAEFARVVSHPQIKMVEIKLSQGAKPGKGGILPKSKITPEIAKIRNVRMGEDVLSPSSHAEWDDAVGLMVFLDNLRRIAGKPVGIKFCLGDPEFLDDLCAAVVSTGVAPDYIQVDGADGGTGAAPLAHTNLLGYPMLDAVMMAENKLIEHGLRERIRIGASSKVWTGAALATAIAAGADFAVSARGFMLSLGCIQALHCNTNFCPAGVATHSKWLQRGLVPAVKSERVANYHEAVVHDFVAVLGSCGYTTAKELSRKDLMKVVGWHEIETMDELVPYPDFDETVTGSIV